MSTQEEIDLLTYKINGAIFEVNRVLGSGFLEKVYENALLIELRDQGLKVESQRPISVLYKGEVVGEYLADILVVKTRSFWSSRQLINFKRSTKLNC